jgi:hypothetical protein
MAERSRFWDGTTIGDATVAPYDAGTEFAEVMIAVAGLASNPNKGGSVSAVTVTNPSANTVRIGPLEAIVHGTWYQNDANVDITTPTPAAATRIDLIVLRKSWTPQTVRMFRVAGTEGGAAPALTQTVGVTWDVPIASISITTAGVITITPTSTRADLWYRTSDTTIRTDNNAGIGASFPTGMGPAIRGLELGTDGIIWGSSSGLGGTLWGCNLYHDGSNFRAVQNGGSTQIVLTPSSIGIALAASATPGGVLTFGTGFLMNANRSITLTPIPNAVALILTNNNTTAQAPALQITRSTASTQNQWLTFQNGATAGDYYIGRRPNNDALRFSLWNGVSLVDRAVLDEWGAFNLLPVQANALGIHIAFGNAVPGPAIWQSASPGGGASRAVSLGMRINNEPNSYGIGGFDNGTVSRMLFMTGADGGGGGRIDFFPAGANIVGPAVDNSFVFGDGAHRWQQLWATNGAIQTCSITNKQILGVMDDALALEQIVGLPAIYRFHYLRPKRIPGVLATEYDRDGRPLNGKAESFADGQDGRPLDLEPNTDMEFIGPIAEEMPMDMKVADKYAGNVNSEGHLMAALRGLVKEYRATVTELRAQITALEGKVN